ncbi:retrovirus-related pol polyprotein from transposon TNT 1-94 [Tanacetum coccineum]
MGNYAAGQPRVVKCYNCQGEGHMARQCTQPKRPRNVAWFKEKLMLAEAQEAAFQTEDLDAYDSDCDDLSSAKAVLMANLSSCDSDVLSEVPYSDSSPNDMINQDESQDAVIQDTNSSAPNDLLVLSLVEQMTDHVAHLDKENQKNKMVNESLTAELERYKERVTIFKQRQHVDLNKRKKLIDSQMDDLIPNRNAKLAAFQQEIDTLKEKHAVISVINDEETLILEEESRSKMLDKQNDPFSIEKKIKISPVDYSKLNKIKKILVVKKRTTSDAITAGAWDFEHTKEYEITEVQTVFNQMEAAVNQCSVDKNTFEIQIRQLSIDNDQLLKQIMSQEIVHIVVNSVDILDVKKSCVNEFNKCLELETELLKKKYLIEKDVYDKLLKTQSQEKDIVIRKLKDMIKSLSGKDSVENLKKDIDELETINIELEHSVAKLLSENENLRKEREHLKSIYKDQFDSIKKTRVQSKEHCDSLIAQINAKFVENSDS